MKVAEADGRVDQCEIDVIERYFIDQWGFNAEYVKYQLANFIDGRSKEKVKTVAAALADYKRKNPDCNYEKMSEDIKKFLLDIAQADGEINNREKNVLEIVDKVFWHYSKPGFFVRDLIAKEK